MCHVQGDVKLNYELSLFVFDVASVYRHYIYRGCELRKYGKSGRIRIQRARYPTHNTKERARVTRHGQDQSRKS